MYVTVKDTTPLMCSTHDSRIYNESRIKECVGSGEFRGRLLGDGGYACTNRLFTPVLNPTGASEENYNIAHIATRNTIQRTFGVWKSRFRILLTELQVMSRGQESSRSAFISTYIS